MKIMFISLSLHEASINNYPISLVFCARDKDIKYRKNLFYQKARIFFVDYSNLLFNFRKR